MLRQSQTSSDNLEAQGCLASPPMLATTVAGEPPVLATKHGHAGSSVVPCWPVLSHPQPAGGQGGRRAAVLATQRPDAGSPVGHACHMTVSGFRWARHRVILSFLKLSQGGHQPEVQLLHVPEELQPVVLHAPVEVAPLVDHHPEEEVLPGGAVLEYEALLPSVADGAQLEGLAVHLVPYADATLGGVAVGHSGVVEDQVHLAGVSYGGVLPYPVAVQLPEVVDHQSGDDAHVRSG